MHKHSSPVMQLTQRDGAFWIRHLRDEFYLLLGSFLDIRDAFDADELPLAFILRRDSRLTKAIAGPRQTFPPRRNTSVPRRAMSRTHSRAGRRKQMPDARRKASFHNEARTFIVKAWPRAPLYVVGAF